MNMMRILDKVKLLKLRRERYLKRVEQTPPKVRTPQEAKNKFERSYHAIPGHWRKSHRKHIAMVQELARKARHAKRTSWDYRADKAAVKRVRKYEREYKRNYITLGRADAERIRKERYDTHGPITAASTVLIAVERLRQKRG